MLKRSARITNRKANILLKEFAVDNSTAKEAARNAKVHRNTANLYYNHFRGKIFEYTRKAPRFMGEVEMDQAFFGRGWNRKYGTAALARMYGDPIGWELHKKKNKKKKKKDKKILVFGIARRGGDVYTHIIEHADRKTLFPIIHMVVEPGSRIFTDQWKAFESLKIDGYKHCPLNHSIGPVGPKGEHTGSIDAFWRQMRKHFGRFAGIPRHVFPLHMKEFEMRYNMRDNKDAYKFQKFMKKILSEG